ncbi:WYL domain-containing protein [Sanguibacter sp. 25GB23B1]|uniref:helix-turn-helix transcriptional regulator n=1 Tax=unclassified Sanguibacter TaxID=2645534 RepID=UPI0032AEDC45
MRADRLVATLLLLQSRGRATAGEIAHELEVSVATARRDLEALSSAGVPVYPQPGRGGGWSLVGGSRTDLTGLTAGEAQALFLALGPAASGTPEVRSALRKLARALPAPFRADADVAAGAIVRDPLAWGGVDRPRPALVDLLQDAVVRSRKVRLDYAGRAGTAGRAPSRVVDPWGLADKNEVWYLVAGTPAGRRTFRVDRIRDAHVTDEPASRPEGLDLAQAWAEVVDDMEVRRSQTWATVLVDPRHAFVLHDQFGRHCVDEGTTADGRARVRVAAPTAGMIAQHLAGWGADVEVIDPSSVRDELARTGAQLVARYGRATS